MSYSQTSSSNTENLDPGFDDSASAGPGGETPTDTGFERHASLERLVGRFGNIRLEFSCDLGRASMNMRALLALKKGSVVAVDRPVDEDLAVRLNGVFLGRADVMIVDTRVLLRITEISHED